MNETKKILAAFICLAMILSCIACGIANEPSEDPTELISNAIAVTIDGTALEFDAAPYIENGRTMVPMRAIFEALGCDVTWNNDTKSATAVSERTTVKLTIGESTMYVNNLSVTLDQAAEIKNDRTFVPVRAVSESLGCTVNWNNDTRTVEITSAETTPITITEDIASTINEAGKFAFGWFWQNQHSDTTDVIESESAAFGTWNYERVTEEGVTSLNDLRELALQYFTSEAIEEMIDNKLWIEKDGALYVSADTAWGGPVASYYLAAIKNVSESEYSISLYGYWNDEESGPPDTTDSFNCYNVNGHWVLDGYIAFPYDIPISVISLETYDDILNCYYTVLSENWDMQQIADLGLCYLCGYDNISQVGYTFIDINDDGTSELLIGEVNPQGADIGMFFDLYTIVDGKTVLVASSAERDRYYLCSNYIISNEGSSSASNTMGYFYSLSENGELSFIEAAIYDSSADEENPWFYSNTATEPYDPYAPQEEYVSVSEAKIEEVTSSYIHTPIQFTPFSEYSLK